MLSTYLGMLKHYLWLRFLALYGKTNHNFSDFNCIFSIACYTVENMVYFFMRIF